jgi:uncharacterized membrane protein YqjE
LWAAHRELSKLEWSEFRQTVLAAAGWVVCAAIGVLAGWLALNVAVLIVFREWPLGAAAAIVAVNFLGAAIAGWRARRLLRRPFFALTKREAAHDLRSVLKVM